MLQEQQERLIELYEKGVLTKEEAKACFLEMKETDTIQFVEERTTNSFSLPHLKVFSSHKQKQICSFADVESMKIRMTEGRICFQKGKGEEVHVTVVSAHAGDMQSLPCIEMDEQTLQFEAAISCQLTICLPEKWMSILDLEFGQADVRLDYLPFEDISIYSHSDKKQQDIRIHACATFSQHLSIQLRQAPLQLTVGKNQAVQGECHSQTGLVQLNHKKEESPYFFSIPGENKLYLHIQTETSPLTMKGVKHVRIL